MSNVIYPPHYPQSDLPRPWIFLAGSIEMGKAEDWQTEVINALKHKTCTLFNPRRSDWDSSWIQSIDNPQFKQQVDWELDHLQKADIIAMYLAPGTVSPISLLELGLHIGTKPMIICCPKGFQRKGNVEIVAKRYGAVLWSESKEDFINLLIKT